MLADPIKVPIGAADQRGARSDRATELNVTQLVAHGSAVVAVDRRFEHPHDRIPRARRQLTGRDRAMLYCLAVFMGLRAQELASPATRSVCTWPIRVFKAAIRSGSNLSINSSWLVVRSAMPSTSFWLKMSARNRRLRC